MRNAKPRTTNCIHPVTLQCSPAIFTAGDTPPNPATHRVLGTLWRHHTGRTTHSWQPLAVKKKNCISVDVRPRGLTVGTPECDENGCCCHLAESLICLWRCLHATHEVSRSELTTVLAWSKLVLWTNLSADWPTFLYKTVVKIICTPNFFYI